MGTTPTSVLRTVGLHPRPPAVPQHQRRLLRPARRRARRVLLVLDDPLLRRHRHLDSILTAALLAVAQATPVIRHTVTLYQRTAGYVAVTLVLVSNAGALATQAGVGLLAILSTVGIALAVYNIRRMQIDQHRKWMLRVWFYMGSIITLRLIMALAALVISAPPGSQHQAVACPELAHILGSAAAQAYPACATSPDGYAVVEANFDGNAAEVGAALDAAFPMALWLALFLHGVGVEVYIMLTPREHERLRRVSYERQLARGYAHPGSAGLVPEMVGDMDGWAPPVKAVEGA
ncbi:hypothetical protein HWV62_21768 [Athelia sp. TMB]|nr:hypothetical protein HWV62_21768 [Athelia sp. TMB]